MSRVEPLIQLILKAWPDTQAIYLFGSWGTEYERAESDVDIAILLPPKQAKGADLLLFGPLHQALMIDEEMMHKLQGMVGFRNILVHEYQELDMAILIDVIEHGTRDLLEFAAQALRWAD